MMKIRNAFRGALFAATLAASGPAGVLGPMPAFGQSADSDTIAFGRGIAQRFCGQCHAVAEGLSPFADAPPFRDLHLRYGAGGLEALLKEGMLTPDPSMEEGNMPGHPRMPQRRLDVDERAALAAYLRSIEPPRSPVARGARGT